MIQELTALKYENSILRSQALQTQFERLQAAAQELRADQKSLLTELRKEAEAGDTDLYDLANRKFVKKEKTDAFTKG